MNKTMNKDFDTLWNSRKEASYARCPLSSERMEQMLNHAMASTGADEQTVTPLYTEPTVRRRAWLFAPLAAAAALALLLIPTRSHAAAPRTINYEGQRVKFICNNHCEADGVIGSFDQYIHTL